MEPEESAEEERPEQALDDLGANEEDVAGGCHLAGQSCRQVDRLKR